MQITRIQSLWPEKQGFVLDRKNIGQQSIFLHYLTPVNLLVQGRIVRADSGSVIVYPPGARQWFCAAEMPLLHDWMHMTGCLNSLMQDCGLEYGKLYYPQNSGFITKIMQEIELEFMSGDLFSARIMQYKTEELFFKIARAVNAAPENRVHTQVVDTLIQVRAGIHRAFDQNWTVAQMAERMHISPSRFFELYKKVFGISPKQDLQNVRMEHAKHLLLQKKYSVRQVAEQIGYENEYYFIRKFKETTGVTPARYGK